MTAKERLMRAIQHEKTDRLPVIIHQWQQYQLDTWMRGMDASIQHSPPWASF